MEKLKKQNGFTLVELAVVVLIMAILAGSIMFAFNRNTVDNSLLSATKYEMQQIRESLLRFKLDNQTFPPQTSPADIAFLYTQGSLDAWNPDYKTGWRGPYMSGGNTGIVDIGDNLASDGSGVPHVIDTSAVTLQRAIPDPFTYAAVMNGQSKSVSSTPCLENVANDNCLLDWRLVGSVDSDAPLETYGRPYLIFDLNDSAKARIVSMGENGVYDSGTVTSCTNKFTPVASNDDLVLCIF